MEPGTVFNPLDKTNLGNSVVEAMLERPALPLTALQPFTGAGIYAIYYHGDLPAYRVLSRLNQSQRIHPIYVGKAVPKGGRKGTISDSSLDSSALFARLQEHRTTLESVDSLNIQHFSFRYLVVDDIWISLGETLVIQRYHPLWNQVIDGFGNHDPGGGRYGGKRPLWDELHPGREWALKCQPAKLSIEGILGIVERYMKNLAQSVPNKLRKPD